jgi:sorbitol/mannitol transport system permease protein
MTITAAAWLAAAVVFFPIFWMFLSGFKAEVDAVAAPPVLIFRPTLQNYIEVQERADYLRCAWNSVVVSCGSTMLALALAVPAAYAMAFFPTRRTKATLLWMMSTRMLPPVGVVVPIYLLMRDSSLLDTRSGLLVIYALLNLPVVLWMLFAFFREVPREVLEAARMDGAGLKEELWHLLLPLSLPGVASTALLSIILAWNEAFWSLNLTSARAAPLTAFIASFSSPEGLFWAKLSAASTMAVAPIVVFGWMTQRRLVRGLTFGAVK